MIKGVVGSTPYGGGNSGEERQQRAMMDHTADSEDLLGTIDGDQSSYFTTKRFHNMQLEQKDDVIEQLKN